MNLFVLIIPLLIAGLAQIAKLAFDGIKGNLTWRHIFNDYGGMPSSHSAFVVSLMTIVAYYDGICSTTFLISFVLALITIRDAMGLRRFIGRGHEALNHLIKKVPALKKKYQLMPIGHTPWQVFVGSIFGFVLTILFLSLNYLLFA